jgi:hypothetical protein
VTGYAASARIVRACPRLAAFGDARGAARTATAPAVGPAIIEDRPVERSIAATEARGRLAERWGRVRDRWSQLVFFVTDPDSWR